jgi:hypothetical protein
LRSHGVVANRIKALYRSWAIPCSGSTVYAPRHRAEWLATIVEPGVRLRAQRLYQQLDLLQPVRQQARRDLLLESHKHQFLTSLFIAFGIKSAGQPACQVHAAEQ